MGRMRGRWRDSFILFKVSVRMRKVDENLFDDAPCTVESLSELGILLCLGDILGKYFG